MHDIESSVVLPMIVMTRNIGADCFMMHFCDGQIGALTECNPDHTIYQAIEYSVMKKKETLQKTLSREEG